jgi:opacity protein-like surface antigen
MRESTKVAGWLGLTCLLLAAAPAAGQSGQQRLIRIGFGGGVSVPVSDAGEALKSGINGQGFLLVNAGGIPLRFNLGYQKFDFEDVLAGGATGESSILSGVAGLSLDLVRAGPVTPYVMAGLGAFNLRDELTTGGVSNSTSATRFGVDGGAGLRLRLGRLEAFAEGRVQNVWTEAGAIDASSIKTIPVTFGVLF